MVIIKKHFTKLWKLYSITMKLNSRLIDTTKPTASSGGTGRIDNSIWDDSATKTCGSWKQKCWYSTYIQT